MFMKCIVSFDAEKQRIKYVALSLSAGILATTFLLAGHVQAQTSQPEQPSAVVTPTEEENVDQWIDPEIQGHEREVMREVLRDFSPQDREKVSFMDDDGTIYCNRVNGRALPVVYVGDGVYTSDYVNFFAKPPSGDDTINQDSISSLSEVSIPKGPNSISLVTNLQSGTGPYIHVTSDVESK